MKPVRLEAHTLSIARRFRETPTRFRGNLRNRLAKIKRRSEYLNGAWLGYDGVSPARDLDEHELALRGDRIGAQIGAAWIARSRGIAA